MATSTVSGSGPRTLDEAMSVYDRALIESRAGMNAEAGDPEMRITPAEIVTDAAFLFRMKPGFIRTNITHIPYKELHWGLDQETPKGRAEMISLKRYNDRMAEMPEGFEEICERAYRANGTHQIVWTPIDATVECFLKTNNEDIATIVRWSMQDPRNSNRHLMYEQHVNREILVGSKGRFPDTTAGRRAAEIAMDETGEGMKFVQRGTDKAYKMPVGYMPAVEEKQDATT